MDDFFNTALGIDQETLTWWQMSVRAVVVFTLALFILRVGNQRIFGRHTSFDIILGIIYGSVLSRAISGNAPFFPTLVAALVLMLMHRGFAMVSYYSGSLGRVIKGTPQILVEKGMLQEDVMRRNSVTIHDLEEAMRLRGIDRIDEVEKAALERNGDISIVSKYKKLLDMM